MGVLADDRPAAFDGWLDGQLAGLAPGIAAEARRWARAARDGTPRSPALHYKSVRTYVAAVRPGPAGLVRPLRPPARGHPRRHPQPSRRAARPAPPHDAVRVPVPVRLGEERTEWSSATRPASCAPADASARPSCRWPPRRSPAPPARRPPPHARLFVALAAVHAARPGQIRALQLSDVDLGNRRLIIAGQARPLDDLTRKVLEDWLAYRRQRWPNTANPHLLISVATAPGTGPVSHAWVRSLRGTGRHPGPAAHRPSARRSPRSRRRPAAPGRGLRHR